MGGFGHLPGRWVDGYVLPSTAGLLPVTTTSTGPLLGITNAIVPPSLANFAGTRDRTFTLWVCSALSADLHFTVAVSGMPSTHELLAVPPATRMPIILCALP